MILKLMALCALTLELSASTTFEIQPRLALDKCESRYNSFIKLSESEECNDIRYALLSYMELQLFYCPLDKDDTFIAQYDMDRLQKCEKRNK